MSFDVRLGTSGTRRMSAPLGAPLLRLWQQLGANEQTRFLSARLANNREVSAVLAPAVRRAYGLMF